MLRVLTTESFATFTRYKSDIELVAAAVHPSGHLAAVGDVEGKITFLKDWNVKVSFHGNNEGLFNCYQGQSQTSNHNKIWQTFSMEHIEVYIYNYGFRLPRPLPKRQGNILS